MDFRVVIDSREQTPWEFPPEVATEIRALKSGDYALAGDEHFAIERKSKNDFLGTISTGWARFCRELNRMDNADFPVKPIVVECTFAEFCFSERNGEIIPPDHEHFKLSPQFVLKRIGELTLRGAAVIFAGNADLAAALALSMLFERFQGLNDGNSNHGF